MTEKENKEFIAPVFTGGIREVLRVHDYVQVIVTTDDQSHAEKLANGLLDAKLAAGVQISAPIQSIYHWQGEKKDTTEWVCTIITRGDKFQHIESFIKTNHHYQVPQIVALPITNGSKAYLGWIDEMTGS